MYSRLAICKNIGTEYAKTDYQDLRANPVALDLGLEDSQGPSVILDQMINTFRGRDIGDSNLVHLYVLEACEKLFDNELDQAVFEEQMRWFFGTKVRSSVLKNSPLLFFCAAESLFGMLGDPVR